MGEPVQDELQQMISQLKDLLSFQTAGVSAKIPVFTPTDPIWWFTQAESQFYIAKITSEETKFHHIVSNLPADVSQNIRDITDTGFEKGKYEVLKKSIISRLSMSSSHRLHAILDNPTMLPGETPGTFYRRLKMLAGAEVSFNVFLDRFINGLPTFVQCAVAVIVSNLLEIYQEKKEVDNKWETTLLSVADNTAASMAGKQTSSLKNNNKKSPHNKNKKQATQRRSKSKSRSTSQSRSQHSKIKWWCYNHSRFRDETTNCADPQRCTYRKFSTATIDPASESEN